MTYKQTLTPGSRVLIIGASGGIGRALALAVGNKVGLMNVSMLSRSADGLDITNESSIIEHAERIDGVFDVIFLATGALKIDGQGPEKSLDQIQPEAMLKQFAINALGPALVLKHFHSKLRTQGCSVFAVLSARVGSIGDNRLGGWISYRSAKAALNQVIRTAAIEINRKRPEAICVALHPGTVRTALTADYANNHPTVLPDHAAQNLLSVVENLTPQQSGGFFDWAGKPIDW